MNRHQRRAAAKAAGQPWGKAQEERIFREGAERAIENVALKMSPEEAREMLAAWASRTDHKQEDIDAMNARSTAKNSH